MRIKEILENRNNLTEKELLNRLSNEGGLKLSEALEVCRTELGTNYNKERFTEAAVELRIENLPSSGFLRKDGATVCTDDWED